MLSIYLFNFIGYKLFFSYYDKEASRKMSATIDNEQYSESDLVEVKVKLNLPYFSAGYDYESFEGEINIEGRTYNYVKRKVSHDTLYILCLPNKLKDDISIAKNNYSSKANDFQNEGKNDNTLKKADSNSQFHYLPHDYFSLSVFGTDDKKSSFFQLIFPSVFTGMFEIPPDTNC